MACLIRPGVYFKELLAFVDVLAFAEQNLGEFASDLRFYGNHSHGLDGSDLAHLNRHISLFGPGRGYGTYRKTASAGTFGDGRSGIACNLRSEYRDSKTCPHAK